jgi:hypothetical protein
VPTLLVLGPYTFRFRSVDCLEREHVHVTGARGSAKVWLGRVQLARSRGYDPHQLSRIAEIVVAHEAEWLEAWKKHRRDR